MNSENIRVLYVDDEPAYGRLFCRGMIDDERYLIETACDGEEALRLLRERPADIVLTDLRMPRMDGLTLLGEIRLRYPDTFVLILTGVDSALDAVRAMKAGAYDYILKPLDMDMIRRQLEKIFQHRLLLKEKVSPADEGFRSENLVGKDPVMFELFEQIRHVARTGSTVLITGESGTGKELIAKAIHAGSARREKPFIAVNCAALTETLINSALFGHEKGAYTGATERQTGFFERASGGTIFLDEIGDIHPQTQVALLRVLELGTFQRVGGTETIHVDVRVICATNKDLSLAVREKDFREDLFFRINVVSLTAPPLRTRKSDIPLLADFFLDKYRKRTAKNISGISGPAMALLDDYPWPGNVRELANSIERAVVFCDTRQILPEHLPLSIRDEANRNFLLTLRETSLASAEAALIRKVLEEKAWNLSQAAEALGIARGTLYGKIERYSLHKPS